MKKILSLVAFLMLMVSNAVAASVDDLVAVEPGYIFIADNFTAKGRAKLEKGSLYDEGRIFANTGNSVATNKGKSTIGGVEYLNSLRLKSTQDQLVFKVAKPCVVKFYTQSHSSRGIQVGSEPGGTQYGKEPVSTTEWECAIPVAGVVYLSSFGGDFYFAGFEVLPMVKTVTFINDANWEKVYVWAWNDTENFTGGNWPGVELTAGEGGLYTWTTTGDPTGIIFSDGASNKTEDQAFKDGGSYNSKGRIIVLNDYAVSFKSDGGWQHVYAYTWTGEEEQLGGWPGKEMTLDGIGEWSITFQAEEAPTKIIFHNNEGVQTPDLDFEADKTYEYNLNTYTATFTTDAAWENVYAWIWSGEKETLKNLSKAEWPGDKLEAVDGVYTFTYKAFEAPEKILFNGGEGVGQTPDMGFTNGRAYKWNTKLQPLFTLEASEEKIPAGTTVDVKDAQNDVVATLTYGVEGGADFAAPTARVNEEYDNFKIYTAGNGENGTATSGTVYYLKPVYAGTVTVGVWLNANKDFFIQEDNISLEGFDGYKQAYGSGTAFTFDVKAGSTYAIYCTGSKLGFYGFDYTFDKPVGTELANVAALKAFKTDIEGAVSAVLTLNDVKVNFVTTKEATDYDEYLNEITVQKDYVLLEDASAGYILEGSGLGKLVKEGDVLNGKLAISLIDNFGWGIYTVTLTNGIQGVEITAGEAQPIVVTNENVMDYLADNDCRLAQFGDAVINVDGTELSFKSAAMGDDPIDIMDIYKVIPETITDGAVSTLTGYMLTSYGMTFFVPTAFVAVVAEPAYYLVGNMNEWTPSEDFKLVKNENAETEEYMITVELAAEAQFKVVKVEGDTWTWYPDGTGNNYGENGELTAGAGTYTIYFRPNGDGNEDWFNSIMYVSKDTGTGIKSILADKDAVIYNMQGVRVNNAQKGLYIVNGKKVVLK